MDKWLRRKVPARHDLPIAAVPGLGQGSCRPGWPCPPPAQRARRMGAPRRQYHIADGADVLVLTYGCYPATGTGQPALSHEHREAGLFRRLSRRSAPKGADKLVRPDARCGCHPAARTPGKGQSAWIRIRPPGPEAGASSPQRHRRGLAAEGRRRPDRPRGLGARPRDPRLPCRLRSTERASHK
jgi:hypothetical protein